MQEGCHERACGTPDAGTTDSASAGIRASSEAGAGSSAEDCRSGRSTTKLTASCCCCCFKSNLMSSLSWLFCQSPPPECNGGSAATDGGAGAVVPLSTEPLFPLASGMRGGRGSGSGSV
eukprot:6191545-Pleurochrysis_carterae.AAC.1